MSDKTRKPEPPKEPPKDPHVVMKGDPPRKPETE